MLRTWSALVLASVLLACAQRPATTHTSDLAPADSTWASARACAQDILQSAGYEVRFDPGTPTVVRAQRPGRPVTGDPSTEAIDHSSSRSARSIPRQRASTRS